MKSSTMILNPESVKERDPGYETRTSERNTWALNPEQKKYTPTLKPEAKRHTLALDPEPLKEIRLIFENWVKRVKRSSESNTVWLKL